MSDLRALGQRLTTALFSAHPSTRERTTMAAQALLLMAAAAGVLLWAAEEGMADLTATRWWAAISVGGLLVMTLMLRLNLTARWRDPSMVLVQMFWAVTSGAVAYVLADEARGIVPGVIAMTLLFATLSLSARETIAIGIYTLLAFVVALVVAVNFYSSDFHPALDLAHGAMAVIVLGGCMTLNLRLSRMRTRLQRQRRELAQALEENRELASRDVLTGQLNRRYMLELMHLEQRRCQRGTRSMTLVLMDIDHFKNINDTYGHHTGDLALKAFAELVRTNVRNSDILARWGGEEFVLLLSDADTVGACEMLERLRMRVAHSPIPGAPEALRLTVSMGLARHVPGETVEATLERADKALYKAKQTGRNRLLVATLPLHDTALATPPMV